MADRRASSIHIIHPFTQSTSSYLSLLHPFSFVFVLIAAVAASCIMVVAVVQIFYQILDDQRGDSLVSIAITLTVRGRILAVAPIYCGMSPGGCTHTIASIYTLAVCLDQIPGAPQTVLWRAGPSERGKKP